MEKFDALKTYLSGLISFPPLEWFHLIKLMRVRTLEKGEFFFRQGEPASDMAFVLKGLLYNFYTDANGDDFVKYFIPENNVVACYSSLLKGASCSYSSQALEPVTMLVLKYSDLQKLMARHVCWERLARLSTEKLYIEKEEREQYFLMADAKTRYEGFLRDRPGLGQRIPQYLIASYIGISPVSLSRLRAT